MVGVVLKKEWRWNMREKYNNFNKQLQDLIKRKNYYELIIFLRELGLNIKLTNIKIYKLKQKGG